MKNNCNFKDKAIIGKLTKDLYLKRIIFKDKLKVTNRIFFENYEY